MNRGLTFVATSVFALASISSASATTRYAKVNGSSTGNCDGSWSNACTLDHALSEAISGDEVWVQAGTYPPIILVSGVNVIGGFAGTETDASDSDPVANQTIIDGGGARAVDSAGATMLRGFYIRNGNESDTDGGGGLRIQGGSPLIVQCVFENNKALCWGGAVAIVGAGSAAFVNCIFRDNGNPPDGNPPTEYATYAGAAVFVKIGTPTFTNCLFHDNEAGDGAAFAVDNGAPTIVNCTFENNKATIGYGGAVFDEDGKATIRNSILWGNTAAKRGNQIYSLDASPTTVTYSDVQGGWTGTGNIDSDPKFQDSANDDYTLLSTSPCRNAGLDSDLPADVGDIDWDGITSETIPQDLGLCKRQRASVDMGAYEYQDSGCCEDGDCAGSQVCIDYECEECVDDGDCSSPEPYCKVSNHTCVECLNDGQCGPGELCCNNVCESWECCDGSDCGPPKPMCRMSDHTCWRCLSDSDCPPGQCCSAFGACGSFGCGGGGGGGGGSTNQSSAPPP